MEIFATVIIVISTFIGLMLLFAAIFTLQDEFIKLRGFIIISALVLIVISGLYSVHVGRTRSMCITLLEYQKSAADSLRLIRRYDNCLPYLKNSENDKN